MASIGAVGRLGQVLLEAGIEGAGNVRREVLLAAPSVVAEVVPAVDDDPAVAQVRLQVPSGDDRLQR